MKALKSRRIFKASSRVFLSIFFVHAQKLFIRSTVGLMCSRFLPPPPPPPPLPHRYYHCSVLPLFSSLFFFSSVFHLQSREFISKKLALRLSFLFFFFPPSRNFSFFFEKEKFSSMLNIYCMLVVRRIVVIILQRKDQIII